MKILGQVRLGQQRMDIIAGPFGQRYLLLGPSTQEIGHVMVQRFGRNGLPEEGVMHVSETFFRGGSHPEPDTLM